MPTSPPVSSVWATHMKTTIDLPDDLLARSKALVRRENSTLKALIEEGLQRALLARIESLALTGRTVTSPGFRRSSFAIP